MKYFYQNIIICFTFAFVLLSSCSNTPGETRKSSVSTKDVALSAEEQKSYQDALEAIKANDAEEAIQPLVRISKSHPDHIGAWINLANAYLKTMKIDEAESAAARAESINVKIAEIYNLEGLLAVHRGEYTKAEKSYKQAITLKENYPDAHYNLGLLYDTYYQDLDRAIVQYDRYLVLSGGTDKQTLSWVEELKQKVKRRNK